MPSAVAIGIVGGVGADRLLGDPARGHPVAAFGRAAERLEERMFSPRRAAGAAYAMALVGAAASACVLLDFLIGRRVGRTAFAALATWSVLGGRSLEQEAVRVADAVAGGDVEEARRLIPALVGRDPTGLDGPELCRAVVESVAENTVDAVVAPLLWCAVAGPAGAVVYRAANTLDAMVGHRNDRYERFGWAAARLDDVLTWPAARLGAFLAVALAPLVGGEPARAWRVLCRDGRSHPSPNAGMMEAAFAGALGLRLGGSNRYGDVVEHRPQIGDGAPPDAASTQRAVHLSRAVGLAAAAVCALAASRLHR